MDFGVYWAYFKRDTKDEWPVTTWLTNSSLLSKAEAGDRLWLFTSGANAGMSEEQAGYLVEIFTVAEVQGGAYESDYPVPQFGHRLIADRSRTVAVDPPILVDDLFRSPQHEVTLSAGNFLQAPRKLKQELLVSLVQRVRDQPHDRYQAVWGADEGQQGATGQ